MLKVAFMALALSVAGSTAVSADEGKDSPEMAQFKSMLKGANGAVDAAAKVGGEWRDIRWKKSAAVKVKGKDGKEKKMSILAAAEEYAKMGDFKKANKLVNKAVFQADMGYKQALEQKNAGPHF
jgi:hypothetical protein